VAGHQFADPDAAWKLADQSSMTIDDDGEVTGVEEAIEALVAEHPFIVGVANSDEPTMKEDSNPFFSPASSGTPMAGKRRPRSEPSAAALAKKYPALRR
jgi:hypothetical protein